MKLLSFPWWVHFYQLYQNSFLKGIRFRKKGTSIVKKEKSKAKKESHYQVNL
jgi:hypothetical protein